MSTQNMAKNKNNKKIKNTKIKIKCIEGGGQFSLSDF